MPATPATLSSAATNLDQQQQPDQGWRMPQYRPMMRKEDQAGSRREAGLPWTGLPPQLGQDRWLPPSAHHQVAKSFHIQVLSLSCALALKPCLLLPILGISLNTFLSGCVSSLGLLVPLGILYLTN